MALPIAPTPILRGRDAERFERIIRENEQHPHVLVAPKLDMVEINEILKKIREHNNELHKS